MSRRLVERNPETGIETWYHSDPVEGTITIEEIQDVESILDYNHAIQNIEPGGALGLTQNSRKAIRNGWWWVGHIPLTLAHKWLREEQINIFNKHHWPRVKAKLNDRDWYKLRTGLGRV